MSRHADDSTTSNNFIEDQLDKYLESVSDHLDSDVITIFAPMYSGVDDLTRSCVEAIPDKRPKLAVILETGGGSIEVVERIAGLLRFHYPKDVSFFVPGHAMSAGTVLVMAGNSIHMDYYSVLGPIDPQVQQQGSGGRYVPALGYLEKYEEFLQRSNDGLLSEAEVMLFLNKFDPAELHSFEQARDLSIELLENWLEKYKFRNWKKTETNGTKVTPTMRRDRAKEIAHKLNDVKRWKSHSRTLSMEVLSKELNLVIDDFAADSELNKRLRSYYRLLQDYMLRRGQSVVVHGPKWYEGM